MTIFNTNALPNGYYSPPTGISRFSATYDDATHEMRVTVKGFVEFLTPNGKLAWDVGRQQNFLLLFRAGVDDTWSQKFNLVRHGDHVQPIVEFQQVALGNEHLKITVQAGIAVPELAAFVTSSSHMNLFPAGLDVALGNLVLRLDEGTVLSYHELIAPVTTASLNEHASQIEVFDESSTLATNSLRGNRGHITFQNGSSAVDDDQITAAMDYMRTVVQNGMGRVPLEVTGYRNSSEAANLSQARANAVAAEVRRVGRLKPAFVSTVDGGSRYFGHRYAKIRPLSMPRILAKVDYKAAIHEFGHCLGLPDEYRLYDGMSISTAHDQFEILCRSVPIRPRPYPAKHDSIMSCGMSIYPSHYVTILDCLRKMTNQNDWTIG